MVQKGSIEFWTRIAGLKVQSANPSHHRTLSGDFAMTFEVQFYVFHGWEKKKRRKWCKKVLSSFELASLDWKSRVLTHHTIEPFLVTLRWPLKFILCLSWLGKRKKEENGAKGSIEFWTRIAGLKVQSANPSHHRTLSGDFAMTFEVHFYVFHGWEKKKRRK